MGVRTEEARIQPAVPLARDAAGDCKRDLRVALVYLSALVVVERDQPQWAKTTSGPASLRGRNWAAGVLGPLGVMLYFNCLGGTGRSLLPENRRKPSPP